MGCRAQGDCLPFPEGESSRGEVWDAPSVGSLAKGGCLAQGTQLQGLSLREVAGFSCSASATTQGSEQ